MDVENFQGLAEIRKLVTAYPTPEGRTQHVIRIRTFSLAASAFCALTGLLAVMAAPAAAAQAASSAAASAPSATSASAALETTFEAARHLATADVGGISAGTLHTGSAGGHEWAIASFTPAKAAPQTVATDFQDGAATGVFMQTHGTWRLVQTGLYGCGNGLPAALKTAWHLGDPGVCNQSPATERAAAQRALSALPAPARAAATAAAAPAKAAKAATAAPAAATSSASLGQTISAIALSEVGVSDTPVVANFNGVDCDPFSTLVAGFSADSDGCGSTPAFGVRNENETWCSDFNKWVWQQAGVTANMNTLNAGAVSFYNWAVQDGQTPQIDTGTPQAGDSVVFFGPGNFPGFADHVGIITSVSSDGTIDMVNGDFSGGPDIQAQYDTGITSLSAFGATVEGNPGEQWVLVTPPTTAQQPTPAGHMSGPAVAVAGTTGDFHVSGTVPGGTVTGYYWTFGDGRTTNATGADVTHAFSEAGTYTASVTITSSFGTIVTLEQNVRVVAPSSGVAAVPADGIWYDPLPILQYAFTRSAGALAVDTWDGGSWLQLAVPGDPSATGNFATLSYPDAANADNMTAHAYYRGADGSLAETYESTSGWVTQDLPGQPAAGGTIVATTTTSGTPAVFFVDTAGKLSETSLGSGGWTNNELLHGGVPLKAASLTLTDTTSGPEIFAVGPAGTIWVASPELGHWLSTPIPAVTTSGGSLAAFTTPNGRAAVVYVSARGSLAEATDVGPIAVGPWNVTSLPGTPAAGTDAGGNDIPASVRAPRRARRFPPAARLDHAIDHR